VKEYRVDVVGNLWSGPEAVYTYSMEQDDEPTAAQIQRRAGDFECVTDYRITRFEPCPTCGHSLPAVIRDWALSDSSDTCYRITRFEPCPTCGHSLLALTENE
jgi:hypothetical protein